jgi:CubicO group peptidase (beta-lactamase class C family)
MADFVAWHGETLAQHEALRDKWMAQGYRFLSLSIYGAVAAPTYAAVMIKRPVLAEQRDWPSLTANQWQQTFDQQAEQGFGPVILAATGSADNPRFAAVFQPQKPIPFTRHGLTSGDAGDPGTIQGANAIAKRQGLILRWAASYGSSSDPRFAGIWMPNPGEVLWNDDGLLDDPSSYQARFNAETSAWCRPAFVTLDSSNSYMSVFVDGQIGPWQARHNLTPAEYQTEFNSLTKKNYFPICVQAAGAGAVSARFAALFVQSEDTLPKRFTPIGPIANAQIDAAVEQVMQTSQVRHASLAIVNGTRLVYARGYTLAEPNWPIAQPTTFFRLASVSKTVTALAIFQLIESGQLKLTDTLQSILQLKTPAGGNPTFNFFNITIQHLLEHKSNLDPAGSSDAVAVVNSFKAASRPATFPVTRPMIDSYIASLRMTQAPGEVQKYSNCGYYLLGRIAGHFRGKDAPIDAYQSPLLEPLGITRIRATADLVSAQPCDEARYQTTGVTGSPDLTVDQSVMSPDRPLVPAGYGDDMLGITQAAGGLSAAATAMARLIAIFIDQEDNPVLKRATIVSMLEKGAALSAAGLDRAGYGLDFIASHGGGNFYGQKGGDVQNAASVFQFNDEWGFVALWGSPAIVPVGQPSWYPNFDAVMNVAKAVDWGTTDLFPEFGMRSL